MGSSKKGILRTLAYSDIFDYPLTTDELWRFLISSEKIEKASFEKELASLSPLLAVKNGWYCFSERREIIGKRRQREKESKAKFYLAQKLAAYLSLIPTVYLIGISGALAMRNADKTDDIDFFIITKKNTLWITRLLLLGILEVLGKRRRRNERYAPNKICLNMLIDESALCLSKERQDLYNAHEVLQMMPVFERNNMYKKFIGANIWVKKFLPNAFRYRARLINIQNHIKSFISVVLRLILRFSVFEFLAMQLQLWYIGKHKTRETIKDNFLAFHPKDKRHRVLREYEKRTKRYSKI